MENTTTTLADALLDDLDDLSDVGETVEERDNHQDVENNENDIIDDDGMDQRKPSAIDGGDGGGSFDILAPRLLKDSYLQKHVTTIRDMMYQPSLTKEERETEHKLIVQSNKHLSALSQELTRAHTELCRAYQAKFPELEELVPSAVQYVKAVRVIGNEMDMTRVTDGLNDFLTNNQIITISVAGSTTGGRPLTSQELKTVDVIALYIEEIIETQSELERFVESRMEGLAPSVCALVGPATAAKLLGLAGGLAELSKIPSCNLQVLGQVRQNSASRAGFSSSATKPHQGILAECELVQSCPRQLQTKALKMVAAKLALAARCDFVNVDTGRTRSAESGRKFRREVEQKFVKLQEPDKAPVLKALPKPDMAIKKRRGGKRMRRLKERYEETNLMKQANTRAFSAQAGEYGDDAMGLTLGLLDTAEVSAGGALRKNTEKKKMKFANTRASRKRAAQMNANAANVNSSGLASSMVFTPIQGMELVNPDANKDRVKEANRKWFSENAGFQSSRPKS